MTVYISLYLGIGSLLAAWSWNAHGSKSKVMAGRTAAFKFACNMIYILLWPLAVVFEVVRLIKR